MARVTLAVTERTMSAAILTLIVPATIALAITVDLAALVAWLRRQSQ